MMSRLWIIALLLLAMGSVAAQAEENQSVPFISECAPWDGEALGVSFSVGHIGAKFEGVIWGKGLIAFRSGKSFTIDNVVGPEGTGRAGIVVMKRDPSAVPDMTEVTARFDPPSRVGGIWTITVKIPDHPDQDLIYFVRPVMSGRNQKICR